MSNDDFHISNLFDLQSELKHITNFLSVGVADNLELESLCNQHLLNTSKSLCDSIETLYQKIHAKELYLLNSRDLKEIVSG